MADDVDLRSLVRDIEDYPTEGVVFRDITPLLNDPAGLTAAIEALSAMGDDLQIDRVVGVESRGFIFAAPVALRLGAGFVPVRKAGKLPWAVVREEYELEYGTDKLEIHRDAIKPGERVLIVDDVLATGGTAAATIKLIETLGGVVAGLSFLIELDFLNGRERVDHRPIRSVVHYS
ncbi:MAG: adenine phosphoribosyltransferase [Actinomycetota bacterium]